MGEVACWRVLAEDMLKRGHRCLQAKCPALRITSKRPLLWPLLGISSCGQALHPLLGSVCAVKGGLHGPGEETCIAVGAPGLGHQAIC